jgi:sec-independent protein translocase protein TatA
MFGNLGMGEIAMILVVVLLLFGAKRIPEVAGSFGKGIREFKKNMSDVQRDIVSEEIAPPPPRDQLPPVDRSAAAAADESRPEPKRLLN